MNKTYQEIKRRIQEADCIVIGAGSGLSTAAGFTYDGQRFYDNFQYMHDLYGYNDMYSAGFHPFETAEDRWGFWSKYIYINRYQCGPLPLYQKLLSLVKDKDYFVLTTNVDHQFQLAGFDKNRLFYTQGDYGLFQCSTPCHYETYDNEDLILKMVFEQKDHKVRKELIPRCPHCGKEMTYNLRSDNRFVENEGFYKASKNYEDFLSSHYKKKILFLELGVGYNTPGIIKYPFWRMTYQFKNAFFISISKTNDYIPDEIKNKSLFVMDDIKTVINALVEEEKVPLQSKKEEKTSCIVLS